MNGRSEKRTDCENCPLRTLDHFRAFTSDELAYVSRFKVGEFAVDAGATILMEGAQSAHLFTVLSGWGFRYKTLDDGRRQILNYVMPGDLVGLQGSLLGEMQHSIEALSPVTLCVFERTKLNELYKSYPELAYDLTWIAAREERILDENLLSIGRRSALERAAYLLAFLYQRAEALNLFDGNRVAIPITQQHVADTLGLFDRAYQQDLEKACGARCHPLAEKGCNVGDINGLLGIAGWDGYREIKRPFI